jgi:hypothetical protein
VPRQLLRFAAVFPTLLVGSLKRLYESAVKARHVHDPMIGAYEALN